ncbi:MAG TPA: hypothetical protein VEL76_13220 [Gemmataceae bacterium]|nr:hypothetical protein [Gemmataceae bacterium]
MSRKKQQAQQDTTKNGPQAKPMSREEFIAYAISRSGDKLSAAARQNLEANYGLQYDYPDEYVVFRDDWEGAGRKRRLIRRVLAHGPPEDVKRLSDFVGALPSEEQLRVFFYFIQDPFMEEIWI